MNGIISRICAADALENGVADAAFMNENSVREGKPRATASAGFTRYENLVGEI